jgi:hypothetical protein
VNNKAGSVARQVWQEFSPRDGEELACRDDGIIEVTVQGELEGFGIDPDVPFGLFVSILADRIQTIVMEGRQQMVPACPLHPAAHPLQSDVVNGAAAWVCPSVKRLVRYMRVTAEAN